MRTRRIFCLVIVFVMAAIPAHALSLGDVIGAFSNSEEARTAASAQPENALSSRPDDSVYMVLRLEDTSRLLKWIFSRENIDVFMPLILGSNDSNEIIGGLEILSAIANNTPIKSAALVIGTDRAGARSNTPFFQMAFTVSPELSSVVEKIEQGSASDSDFARLILGNDSPIAPMAETMIKAEREGDMFRIDNEIFLKVQDGMILLGTSAGEVDAALSAINDEGSRILAKFPRRFGQKDFALFHVDFGTALILDTEGKAKDFKPDEYFDSPLNIELSFERLADKFIVRNAYNFREAFNDEYADLIASKGRNIIPVNGGNIDITNAGSKSPLAAIGGHLDLPAIKDVDDLKSWWTFIVKQLKNRFGITEEEFSGLFTGAFSLSVNDSVTFEGFKIPAVYISQTGIKGAARKVYERLTRSPHFHKVQDGILQLDSSISPISCLVRDNGETLGIDFAELSSLSGSPAMKPVFADLMNTPAISAAWLDFAGIQSWITDDENGVMMVLGPIATFGGFGKYFQAFRDVITAEFSVPSVAFICEDIETFRTEFAIADVNPANGLFARLIKIYRDLK